MPATRSRRDGVAPASRSGAAASGAAIADQLPPGCHGARSSIPRPSRRCRPGRSVTARPHARNQRQMFSTVDNELFRSRGRPPTPVMQRACLFQFSSTSISIPHGSIHAHLITLQNSITFTETHEQLTYMFELKRTE